MSEKLLCTGCVCTHPRSRCICVDECCGRRVRCDHYEPRENDPAFRRVGSAHEEYPLPSGEIDCPTCGRLTLETASREWHPDFFVDDDGEIECKICGENAPCASAHLHQGQYVGECCWDERLRATE